MKTEILNFKSETNPKSKSLIFRISNFDIKIFAVIWILALVILLTGCDAFVRKFTRKSKKEKEEKIEMVLVPEEYKVTLSKEDLYRQYFLYWKSWQDELIQALNSNSSHKKQISCAEEALKNLVQLKGMLNPQMQEKLEIYIKRLQALKEAIINDPYGTNLTANRFNSEQIKREILRYFSYPKIKDYLI